MMAKNSFSAFQKIKNFFLRIKCVFDIILPLFPIAFLVYSLAAGMGFLWANIITLALSVAHYVFHVIVLFQAREDKELKQTVKVIYKTCVRFVKFLTLVVSIYGLWLSIAHIDFLSLFLTAVSLFGWIFQVTLDIIIYVVARYMKFLEEAFLVNAEKPKKPAEQPAPSKSLPEPKKTVSVPNEPAPVPSETTPTPNETTPVPSEPAAETASAPSNTENNEAYPAL